MIRSKSLSFRLVLFFVSFTFVVGLLYSALLLGYSWVVEDNIFNRLVASEAQYAETFLVETGEVPSPRAPFIKILSSWQEIDPLIYEAHLKDAEKVEFTINGRTIHLREIEVGLQTLIVYADVTDIEVGSIYFPYIGSGLIAALAFILLISLVVSAWVAKVTFRPLRKLEMDVRALSTSQEIKSFAKPYPLNEIGFLANQIEDSFLQIQSLLSREKAFTQDVSHELRTPLTILRNAVHAMKESDKISSKQINIMKSSVESIEQTINVFLAMARSENQEAESLNLTAIIEEALIENRNIAGDDDFHFDIALPANIPVKANPHLLKIFVRNIIINAWYYAADERCDICWQNSMLIVRNKTLPQMSIERKDNTQGSGIGLGLIRRIADELNWYLTIYEHDNIFQIETFPTNNSEEKSYLKT